MATDDRERLEAIANAIMAPHVAQQQAAGARLRGKRSKSRGWMRIAALCVFLPYVANVLFNVVPEGRMGWIEWMILGAMALALFSMFRRKE